MELLPSDYKELELSRNEKLLIRYACADMDEFGLFLLKINPSMIPGESIHAIISEEGISFIKILEVKDASVFGAFISSYYDGLYKTSFETIEKKLTSNKALVDKNGKLCVKLNYLYIFPELSEADIDYEGLDQEVKQFVDNSCVFLEGLQQFKHSFKDSLFEKIGNNNRDNRTWLKLDDSNVNSVLQRIAPEYTIVRFATVEDKETGAGVEAEMLVVTDDDIAVRAFRLDANQVNIVNKMNKGDQLILACAGSGKSVLLISKCFKAARMNPEKRFLITCYNRNLQSQYAWFIERAGLRERNVECKTFDVLCRDILQEAGITLPTGTTEDLIKKRRKKAIEAFYNDKVKARYYGIFIDEIQMFEPVWYKLCYNMLENIESGEHIFVICGDKTQEIKQRQKHGRAPWNAGDGYPSYRGGNKSLRIEKNFRNCILINEYINRFASNARKMVSKHLPKEEYDPDLFLRGKAFREGGEVQIRTCSEKDKSEAKEVINSVVYLHDEIGVPYDEIAIAMYNRKYWKYYNIENAILRELNDRNIQPNTMYQTDANWGGRYGSGGVSLITFNSSLGLDFQAVIVCGIYPLGLHDQTKRISRDVLLDEEMGESLKTNISLLYVACTRARDYLHIVLPGDESKSIYNKLLLDSK